MTKEISGTAEKRTFQLHKDILYDIIRMQAGTLGKAFLELIMNSIDAGATQVFVTLTQRTMSVSDDGKGFTNRQEIEQFFETFGTPHEKGDATYGRFRMGRGQIMAFTKNRWTSGNFRMAVDVKNLGLNYDLDTVTKVHNGCLVEGEMYDILTPSEMIRVTDNMRELCKYAPIPVFINDERISVDMKKEKWTMEDDEAYYLLKPSGRQLEVYNLGIHVRHYYSGDYGLGGVVVSKKQLEVNFARNDILLTQCTVWKKIAPKLRAHAKQFEDKKPVQNDAYRDLLMGKIISGSFESSEEMDEAMRNAKVFTDYTGKQYSLESLERAIGSRGGLLVVEDELSQKADRVHQKELALVLSPKTFERANGMSMVKILNRIKKNSKALAGDRHYNSTINTVEVLLKAIVDLKTVAASINDKCDIVEDKELSKEEKLTLKVIRGMTHGVANAAGQAQRHIRVCESETINGYTDGATAIFIERKFLKVGGCPGQAFAAFDDIKSLLLHEYLHDDSDSDGHDHPAEFYKKFHDAMRHDNYLNDWTYRAVKSYHKERRKAGFKMRAGDLASLDMMALEYVQDPVEEVVASNVVPITSAKNHLEKPTEPMAQTAKASSPAQSSLSL